MFYGSGIYFGSGLLGRSTAFWPLCTLAAIVLFSLFDSGAGLRRVLLGTWHSIPVIIILLAAALLLIWLARVLDRSGREELSGEIEKNEAAYVAANRPGGWKQYYGTEPDVDSTGDISEEIRRHGWQPSFGPNCDLLASTAKRHREEQARHGYRSAYSALMDEVERPAGDEQI